MKTEHEFSKEGIELFTSNALDEAMANYPPIVLSVGPHSIKIPMFPEMFESMEIMLKEALEIFEEEYKEDEQ